MKFAVFICFTLLLLCRPNYARKDQDEYWKRIMKDQPMPEAIKGLIDHDRATPETEGNDNIKPGAERLTRFAQDFDTRRTAIIYHKQVPAKEEKLSVKDHDADTKKAKSHADDTKN